MKCQAMADVITEDAAEFWQRQSAKCGRNFPSLPKEVAAGIALSKTADGGLSDAQRHK